MVHGLRRLPKHPLALPMNAGWMNGRGPGCRPKGRPCGHRTGCMASCRRSIMVRRHGALAPTLREIHAPFIRPGAHPAPGHDGLSRSSPWLLGFGAAGNPCLILDPYVHQAVTALGFSSCRVLAIVRSPPHRGPHHTMRRHALEARAPTTSLRRRLLASYPLLAFVRAESHQ
jgi:hypothetical protein